MKKQILLVLITLFASINGSAQSINFDIGFALGTPKGTFSQELDRNSYGLDAAVTYQLPQSPIHIGVGLIYQNYGWNERTQNIFVDVPEVDVRVRTTNNMITPHLLMRIEPDMGFISPFVEGSLGFNYLYTESSVLDDWEEDELASTINYDYTTSNFGIGGGVKFKMYDGYDEDGDYFGVSLIVKGKYMVGGEALYLKEDGLSSSNGELDYSLSRSRTDLATLNVGFVLNF